VTTVDAEMISSVCRSVNALTTQLAKMSTSMDKVVDELKLQKTQVQAVVSQLERMHKDTTTKMEAFETDIAAINEDINTRLAEMSRKIASPTYAAAAAASSSRAGPVASAVPAVGGTLPAAGSRRPTRIWLKGFKEVLTTKFLTEYARRAIERISPDLQVGAKPGAPGFGAAVYIDYPANTHMMSIRTALVELNLTHTDDEGTSHNIRVSLDQSLEVRHKGRALGALWKLVEPHLAGLPAADRPKDYKLGNSNGKLFLVLDSRPLELFATTLDDQGNMSIVPNDKNLAKYKVSGELAQSWSIAASRSALRGRQ
jgi:hypothetical protein